MGIHCIFCFAGKKKGQKLVSKVNFLVKMYFFALEVVWARTKEKKGSEQQLGFDLS